MIDLEILACLEDGWRLTHAISLSSDSWQVNISDGEHVCVATGESIEGALWAARARANEGKYAGRLFHLAALRLPEAKAEAASAGRQLLLSLGLGRASAPIKRRI